MNVTEEHRTVRHSRSNPEHLVRRLQPLLAYLDDKTKKLKAAGFENPATGDYTAAVMEAIDFIGGER